MSENKYISDHLSLDDWHSLDRPTKKQWQIIVLRAVEQFKSDNK